MDSKDIKKLVSCSMVLKKYNIQIGRNSKIKCINPNHNDNHPSSHVYDTSVKCFSCGANYDIFNIVEILENVSFKDAAKIICNDFGIEKHDIKRKPKIKKVEVDKNPYLKMQIDNIKELSTYGPSETIIKDVTQDQVEQWFDNLDDRYVKYLRLKDYADHLERNELNV